MKSKLFLFLILFFSLLSFAGSVSEEVESGADLPFDWRIIVFAAMAATVSLIAIALMIGRAFEMHDLEAWAKVELTQTISTVVILLVVFGALTFLDSLFKIMVNQVYPDYCTSEGTIGCAQGLAQKYLEDIDEGARKAYNDISDDILTKQYWAAKRLSFSCQPLIKPFPCFQLSTSITFVPHYLLEVERDMIILEGYLNIFPAILAQKFFLENICFKLGPVLLILGIVGRSLFLTRSLGGLLIAIAIGLMYVYPIMYVFDSATLAVTLYGSGPNEGIPAQLSCPDVCFKGVPFIYTVSQDKSYNQQSQNDILEIKELLLSKYDDWTDELLDNQYNNIEYYSMPEKTCEGSCTFEGKDEVEEYLNSDSPQKILYAIDTLLYNKLIENFNYDEVLYCGTIPHRNPDYPIVSQSSALQMCPPTCREMPYPYSKQECAPIYTQYYCSILDDHCKIDRLLIHEEENAADVFEPSELKQFYDCPIECQTFVPLNKDCSKDMEFGDLGDCLGAPGVEINYNDAWSGSIALFTSYYSNYGDPIVVYLDYDAEHDWVDCNRAYEGCLLAPVDCRVGTYSINAAGTLIMEVDTIGENCNEEDMANAQLCPTGFVDGVFDPEESCVFWIPEDASTCDNCLFVDDSFRYFPTMVVDCAGTCGLADDSLKAVSAADFSKKSAEGMYGTQELRNLSSLMLPAYLLPLLNILVTIIFIKAVSPILGGDIEIPGLSKVL